MVFGGGKEGTYKKIYFSIIKPLNKLLKTPKINKWCAILCNYWTNYYDDFKVRENKNGNELIEL